jgi:hypothetical protein
MTMPRANQGTILLQNGQVLSAGSAGVSAELYDPSKGTWTTTGNMNYARAGAQLTLLQNGEAVIAARSSTSPAQGTAELFSNGHWSLTTSLYFCCYHSSDNAVLLTNGDVVIYGRGNLPSYASEFYNPSTNVGRELSAKIPGTFALALWRCLPMAESCWAEAHLNMAKPVPPACSTIRPPTIGR